MIRINLAPPRQSSRRTRFAWPRASLGTTFAAAAVVILVGLGLWSWSLYREESRLTVEIDGGARELTSLNAIVGPAAKMKEHLADLQARLKALQAVTRDQGRPLSLIDAFADAVPADLWVTGLEERGTILRVTGSAFSATAVSNLMTALRASGRFRDIDIVISRRDLEKAPNVVNFEVVCRFES